MISPKVEEFEKKYGREGVVFIKVDVDSATELSAKMKIQAMPTFHVFKNGSKAGELVGANPGALENLIKSNI